MDLNIQPLEHIGVEVLDVDHGAPLDPQTRKALEALWLEHGVLVFRNQDIDAGQQIAFSALFGDLERHPLEVKLASSHPELFVLDTGSDPAGNVPPHVDLL